MWVADMIRGILGVWNGILVSVTQLLACDPASWSGGGPWAMAANIHRDLMGMALGIMILFWAVSFFRYVEDIQRLDMREMAGWIIRFVIIYVIMEVSMGVMELVLNTAAEANMRILHYTAAAVPEQAPSDVLAAVEDIATGGSLLEQIGAFFQALPLSVLFLVLLIVVVVCGVILIVSVYMRFFKLYLYTAIAPLPLATLSGRGSAEIGKHFLKSWAAVCLEVCIISIAFAVFNAGIANNDALFSFADTAGMDANSALWNGAINWMINILIKIVLLVSVVKGAGRITSRMLGA